MVAINRQSRSRRVAARLYHNDVIAHKRLELLSEVFSLVTQHPQMDVYRLGACAPVLYLNCNHIRGGPRHDARGHTLTVDRQQPVIDRKALRETGLGKRIGAEHPEIKFHKAAAAAVIVVSLEET